MYWLFAYRISKEVNLKMMLARAIRRQYFLHRFGYLPGWVWRMQAVFIQSGVSRVSLIIYTLSHSATETGLLLTWTLNKWQKIAPFLAWARERLVNWPSIYCAFVSPYNINKVAFRISELCYNLNFVLHILNWSSRHHHINMLIVYSWVMVYHEVIDSLQAKVLCRLNNAVVMLDVA